MLARYMLLPVCLSVRPSVTQVDQSKTRHLFIVTALASVLFKMMHFGDYKKHLRHAAWCICSMKPTVE